MFKIKFIIIVILLLLVTGLVLSPSQTKAVLGKIPVLRSLLQENQRMSSKAKLIAISYYHPDYEYFSDIVSGKVKPEARYMDGYHIVNNERRTYTFLTYYGQLVGAIPEQDAARALYGYALYQSGDLNGAIVQYANAMRLTPGFFWHCYNYGVISLRSGDVLRAVAAFERALKLPLDLSVRHIFSSSLYKQIWRPLKNPQAVVEVNLQEARRRLVIVLRVLSDAGGEPDLKVRLKRAMAGLELRIF